MLGFANGTRVDDRGPGRCAGLARAGRHRAPFLLDHWAT